MRLRSSWFLCAILSVIACGRTALDSGGLSAGVSGTALVPTGGRWGTGGVISSPSGGTSSSCKPGVIQTGGAGNDAPTDGTGVLLFGGFMPLQEASWTIAAGFPAEAALADVTGDGELDFIVPNSAEGTVSVWLGTGKGTFSASMDYGTGAPAQSDVTGPAGPASVALGDLDGDGRLDIVAANNYPGTVAVLKGKCDGTFDTKVEYPVGKTPYSAELGDLNGDGKLDIVAANQGSNSVSVLLGNGDGTFPSKVDYATGGGPRRVKLGDLNGDHRLDIVTVNVSSNSVSVLLGNCH